MAYVNFQGIVIEETKDGVFAYSKDQKTRLVVEECSDLTFKLRLQTKEEAEEEKLKQNEDMEKFEKLRQISNARHQLIQEIVGQDLLISSLLKYL